MGRHLNLDGVTLILDGGTRPPYNLSTGYIDRQLNWKHQVKQICSKIARGSWALYHTRNHVDKQTVKMVYYSLVYSHLQYCINSWGSASETTLHPLKIIRKRNIRIITGSKY